METDWIAGSAPFVMWGAIFVFNAAILRLLQVTLKDVDAKAALSEKAPTDTVTLKTEVSQATPPDGVGGGKTERTEETREIPQGAGSETSYSRVSGMVGAVVLACFIWGIGNVVLYKVFAAPTQVKDILDSLGGFFLAGASLFAPYAFNQLSAAFKPK